MDTLEFFCCDLVEHRPVIGTFLFNQQKHLLLQSKKGWRVYGLRNHKTKKVRAQIFIHCKGKEARSPLHAPFGSIELYGHMGQKEVNELLASVEKDLIDRGVEYLQIGNYPKAYNTRATNFLYNGMARLKYIFKEEVSSIIPVSQKSFEQKILIAQRQKLKKSQKLFTFNRVDLGQLNDIYGFIQKCRQEKNQSLSMTLNQLKKAVKILPDNFILFKVGTEDEIAAAAIVVKVSEKILYTFYYSHNQKFNKISPVVFLIAGIYGYARQYRYKLVDLGTSMINHEINKPLLHFKKSIGGMPSVKYIFDKVLS